MKAVCHPVYTVHAYSLAIHTFVRGLRWCMQEGMTRHPFLLHVPLLITEYLTSGHYCPHPSNSGRGGRAAIGFLYLLGGFWVFKNSRERWRWLVFDACPDQGVGLMDTSASSADASAVRKRKRDQLISEINGLQRSLASKEANFHLNCRGTSNLRQRIYGDGSEFWCPADLRPLIVGNRATWT